MLIQNQEKKEEIMISNRKESKRDNTNSAVQMTNNLNIIINMSIVNSHNNLNNNLINLASSTNVNKNNIDASDSHSVSNSKSEDYNNSNITESSKFSIVK